MDDHDAIATLTRQLASANAMIEALMKRLGDELDHYPAFEGDAERNLLIVPKPQDL